MSYYTTSGSGNGDNDGYGGSSSNNNDPYQQSNSQQQWQQRQSYPYHQPQQQQQPVYNNAGPGGYPQPAAGAAPSVNFWNPATAMTMAAMAGNSGNSSDAMFEIAGAAGASLLQQGSARMIPGMHSTMTTLRYYFAVDNRYVSTKIRKVIFPFVSKQWARQVRVGIVYS
jgi:protein transport protein YIF1